MNDGGSIFAAVYSSYSGSDNSARIESRGGLTVRDYFAAKAMSVELSRVRACDFQGSFFEKIAAAPYALADAMLKERDRG